MSPAESAPLKLSIVIPVYNEQDTIGEVIDRVRSVDLGPIAKEIIISDDGSTDATPTCLYTPCSICSLAVTAIAVWS